MTPRHRRRLPRRVLRRGETIAWIAAVGVATLLGGLLVRPGPDAVRLRAAALAHSPTTLADDPGQRTSCAGDDCPGRPTGPPTRVRIPSIAVDSPLVALTLNREGALNPPSTYDRAGWYAAGVVPGDVGPAVVAGHVDSARGPAVFYRLGGLAPGDVVQVRRGAQWLTFTVTEVESYPKDQFPTGRVYRATPDAELRVITCGGDFDPVHKRYHDNVVVYARLA